jgi:peptide/nickel transport system substrate-binding protein
MEESNYWTRLAKRRLSRRRLLAGTASVGAGLAALSLVGCAEEEGAPGPTPSPAASPEPSPVASPGLPPGVAPLPTITPPTLEPLKEGCRGGFVRMYGYDPMPLDTYDPHQTQFGPMYGTHSAVFSKVLKYDDIRITAMDTDLAESMPETPDKLTYVIKIRPNVRFHDTEKIRKNFPQVSGRQLTAEDVKYSIERQTNRESPRSGLYYRMSQWETVDKIEVVDDLTLRITTKKPTAPFKHFLADTNSFIIAKELVDENDEMNAVEKMVGTGPFMLDKFAPLTVVRCVRNPDWFAKDDLVDQGLPNRPIIDGYEAIWTPEDDTVFEATLKTKQVDTVTWVDFSNADRVAAETGTTLNETVVGGFVNSRFLLNDSDNAVTPFKDFRLRQAISIAIDRNRMGQAMFSGSFVFGSPVGQAIRTWAMPYGELLQKPGYRTQREEREEDLRNARQMWEAAGGAAIEPVPSIYTAIPSWVKNYWPQVERALSDVLGLELDSHMDPTGYTEIVQCLLEMRPQCLFGMAYDNGWIDLDDWVYPYFHTNAPKNSFNMSDATLDGMLEAQREEFDLERRQQLGYEIQHYLLDNVLGRLDWVSQINRGNSWPYTKNGRDHPWFGNLFHLANQWFDCTDPTYEGRPD